MGNCTRIRNETELESFEFEFECVCECYGTEAITNIEPKLFECESELAWRIG